jgi:membrane fusion protein (multidrug efflux system)
MKEETKSKKFLIIFSTLFTLGIVYGSFKYIHSQSHETTDDAQIEKNINPIISRVPGYITKVYVKDNDFVKKGDTLFTIDNRDFLVKLDEAEANLVAAESNLAVSKADVNTAQENVYVSNANVQSASSTIETAQIKLSRATNDFERYSNLYKNKSITKQQFEQAEAAKLEAQSQLKVVKEQQNASRFQKNVAASRSEVSSKQTDVAAANIKRAKSLVAAAKLNLEYTTIIASTDGQVSKIAIQPGQFIQPGQSLFYIINDTEVWVIANFKETQLNKMVAGQKVILKVDAFPDTDFEGSIASFSPATGAKFSILPPDNATGNFVKTIQRLPVKITLNTSNDQEKIKLLRPGMNVDVDVILK